MNKFRKVKTLKKRNLISDEPQTNSTEPTTQISYASFWNPEVDISMVEFFETMPSIVPHMASIIKFEPSNINYFPLIYVNEFWAIQERLMQLNETVQNIPLNITFAPLSQWKMHIYLQMEASFSMQQSFGTVGDGQQEEMKRMFLETNPILLTVTMIVSALHSVFDFLAFKNGTLIMIANIVDM